MDNMIGIREVAALEMALVMRGFTISAEYGHSKVHWTATKSSLPNNYFILEVKDEILSLESKIGEEIAVTEFPVFLGFGAFRLAMRIVDFFIDNTRDTRQLN